MQPTLFPLVGLPGSGKTTLARRLETEKYALRLTPDEWMLPLFGAGESGDKRDVLEGLLWTVAARALNRALSLGLNVVLDYGLWGRWERDAYRAKAEAVGARAELRFLDVPHDELWRRIELRNQNLTPSQPYISADDLASFQAVFERPDAAELESYPPA
ncbi:AAA family ATPase [Deinococcus sp.]|uniref:AAA family ATPase n=1 Tax=Deinococcus sp. TaxID=47478 RepID=UPI0025D8D26E|nr:AAA family ATPase [Deinococcus sp.]